MLTPSRGPEFSVPSAHGHRREQTQLVLKLQPNVLVLETSLTWLRHLPTPPGGFFYDMTWLRSELWLSWNPEPASRFMYPNAAWVMFGGLLLTGLPELLSTSHKVEITRRTFLKLILGRTARGRHESLGARMEKVKADGAAQWPHFTEFTFA